MHILKISRIGDVELYSRNHLSTDTLRETQISNFLKILQILYGYHKFTFGFRLMSNLLTEKEVNYESIQSIKNLARLSPN